VSSNKQWTIYTILNKQEGRFIIMEGINNNNNNNNNNAPRRNPPRIGSLNNNFLVSDV
jgi:hypothetical protein